MIKDIEVGMSDIDEFEIETDVLYEHKKTGSLYEVQHLCKFKEQGIWVEGVIYFPKGYFNMKYSCSVDDFKRRFKEV
jgi:hypothetical protein